jgi:beta-N-acetylhexosaminidase
MKHFPGDGVDERDQHVVTMYNTLGYEEWTPATAASTAS